MRGPSLRTKFPGYVCLKLSVAFAANPKACMSVRTHLKSKGIHEFRTSCSSKAGQVQAGQQAPAHQQQVHQRARQPERVSRQKPRTAPARTPPIARLPPLRDRERPAVRHSARTTRTWQPGAGEDRRGIAARLSGHSSVQVHGLLAFCSQLRSTRVGTDLVEI